VLIFLDLGGLFKVVYALILSLDSTFKELSLVRIIPKKASWSFYFLKTISIFLINSLWDNI
jgi:hypothetical protein